MEPSTYRSRINENEQVEAVQLTRENVREVEKWCNGFAVIEHDSLDSNKKYVGLNVPTQFGNSRASEGDYVLQFGGLRFFPMRQFAFEDMYEQI